MKGSLYSQDGSYAFPLGPKVTTIGRENCDISINSSHIDNQHALIEYDDEQRCFVLKDLNSSTGTYVHECRVQNAAVRLTDGDFIRFGFNGLPLEFRIERQQETTMPSIYPRSSASNSFHLITQTIPSRKPTSTTTNQQQQNSEFSLRSQPLSAGTKKPPTITSTNQTSHGIRDSMVRPNAWTTTGTLNLGRNVITGSFSGELDIPTQDNNELTNRVVQLEKEVKGRETEIRNLTEKLQSFEPLNSTFKNEVNTLRTELDKVKREKQAASGLVSSLQRDLFSKESNLAKLNREIDGLKTDSRDKDLRLQALQSKLNVVRDRNRIEEERRNKEKEQKIKLAEQQISELNETNNRFKNQLQEKDKQLLRLNQNEQKLKQECEHTRGQLAEIRRSETKLKSDLTDAQRKHNQLCIDIWHCFSTDDSSDNEYNEDQHDIIEQIQRLQQELDQSRSEFKHQHELYSTASEQHRILFERLNDILTNAIQEQTSQHILWHARQQIIDIEQNDDKNLIEIFKKLAIFIIDNHLKLVSELNNLVMKKDDKEEQELYMHEILRLIRRQYEELELEKQNLLIEQTSHEQTLRSEFERTTIEKDAIWQQRFNEECDRLREQLAQLRSEYDEQSRSFSERIERSETQNSEYIQKLSLLETESSQKIDELTTKLQEYQQELTEEKQQQEELININERQKEELNELERDKNMMIDDLNRQIEVYKDQVRQFSLRIVELEKNLQDEREKYIKLQVDFDNLNKNDKVNSAAAPPPPVAIETIVPVLPTPAADLSQELFTCKSRVQEQEQIIVSLRRDLAGMTARLSDIQGELSEKQKQALEKSDLTIREQAKELNDTRLKLSKLSDIIDKQSRQIETLESDLSKFKTLANQYELLVEQRQTEINRLTKSLEEKNLAVEQVERINYDEGRITHELVAIGAQCKGERHEQTIGRQREALNELRARIKNIEQSRPENPGYEKVLQQVVLLKRELAELRARKALPNDIPNLMTTSISNSTHQPSQKYSTMHQSSSPSISNHSKPIPEENKIIEERAAHAETMNSLQSCDELYNNFTRKLLPLLEIDDDNLVNITPLGSLSSADRHVALLQRQRATEIFIQKIEMLRDRLSRKEELLHDYEKDLGKLRQAEILLREKDNLLQDLETEKRTKDDEALFLQNTLRETQDNLNQEKRLNSSVKLGRNIAQSQSNELIRRSSGSTTTLHHHCPPDSTSKIRTIKRDMNQKITRKDHEIKTLKQELHEALDTISEQTHKVKQLEFQSIKPTNGNDDTTRQTSNHL